MSRILVVFASSHGQTRAIAAHVADRLRTRGHAVEEADATPGRPPSPDGFDAVVVGARVHFGRHHPAVVDYVRRHRPGLAARPTACFSVSMNAAQPNAGPDPDGYLARFLGETGWKPAIKRTFGGGLPYTQYGRVLRFVMKLLARRGGHATDTSRDHVYTLWTAVDRFTDDLAHLVEARPAAPSPRPPPVSPPL